MKFMKYKYIYLIISVVIMIPGLISLALNGLKLSIDFTGGSLIEISGSSDVSQAKKIAEEHGAEVTSAAKSGDASVLIKMKSIDEPKHAELKEAYKTELSAQEERFETVGPSISADITQKAFVSVGVAIIAIILYIAFAFRKVPEPASPWRFGITTIFALVHDVLVLVGVFSLLGYFFGIEVDALFVTAAMTVIGFSVHDTIVVFDRIRENLRRHPELSFAGVVDVSLSETLARSLNTSFTVFLVLLALTMFGGASIRNFVLALLIGIVSGTYSSIFNASPLLVIWQEKFGRK